MILASMTALRRARQKRHTSIYMKLWKSSYQERSPKSIGLTFKELSNTVVTRTKTVEATAVVGLENAATLLPLPLLERERRRKTKGTQEVTLEEVARAAEVVQMAQDAYPANRKECVTHGKTQANVPRMTKENALTNMMMPIGTLVEVEVVALDQISPKAQGKAERKVKVKERRKVKETKLLPPKIEVQSRVTSVYDPHATKAVIVNTNMILTI